MKKLTIEQVFRALEKRGYTITYSGKLINYTVSDGERSAIRSIDDLTIWVRTGRDPFNWLPSL